ncbi:hypothetical protein AYO37_00375 [Opitutia bacterium SCGC AG-212-L18]|nr:hypothetical protein AYO37_00375 [Opitutae bacterium SCGC AG-212-L18]
MQSTVNKGLGSPRNDYGVSHLNVAAISAEGKETTKRERSSSHPENKRDASSMPIINNRVVGQGSGSCLTTSCSGSPSNAGTPHSTTPRSSYEDKEPREKDLRNRRVISGHAPDLLAQLPRKVILEVSGNNLPQFISLEKGELPNQPRLDKIDEVKINYPAKKQFLQCLAQKEYLENYFSNILNIVIYDEYLFCENEDPSLGLTIPALPSSTETLSIFESSSPTIKISRQNHLKRLYIDHRVTDTDNSSSKKEILVIEMGPTPNLEELTINSNCCIRLKLDSPLKENMHLVINTEEEFNISQNLDRLNSSVKASLIKHLSSDGMISTMRRAGKLIEFKVEGGKDRDKESDREFSVEESSGGETSGLRGHAGIIAVEDSKKITESFKQLGRKGITINNDNEVLALQGLVAEGSIILSELEFINITDQGLLPSIQTICQQYSKTPVQINVVGKGNTNNERFSVSQNWDGGRQNIQLQPTGGGRDSNSSPIVIQLDGGVAGNRNALATDLGILAMLKQLAPHIVVVLIFQFIMNFAFRTGQN